MKKPRRTPHGFVPTNQLIEEVFKVVLELREINGRNAPELKRLQELQSQIQERVRQEKAPLLEFLAEAMPVLNKWYSYPRNLDRYGEGRHIDFPAGTLTARMSSQVQVVVDGEQADVIKQLSAIDPKYVIVTTKLDLSAIAEDWNKLTGVKGLNFVVMDYLYLDSPNLKLTKDEKNLLRTVRRVWRNWRTKPVGRVAHKRI